MPRVYYPLYGPTSPAPLTPTEDLNAFHASDRALYTLLIFTLGRDPAESMRVIGLLLWLERDGRDSGVVKRMLTMRPSMVNLVADESVACLKCVETDRCRFEPDGNDIPFLRILLGRRDLGLRFFHENRVSVLSGVTEIVSEVCARAFEDIITHVLRNRNPIFTGSSSSGGVVAGDGGGHGGNRPIFMESSSSGGVVAGGGGGNRASREEIRAVGVPFYPGVGVASHTGYGGLTGNVAQWCAPSMAASSSHGRSWQDHNIGAANYQMPPANEQRRFSDHELTGNVAQWRAPSMAASSGHGRSWQDHNIGAANYQMPPANEQRRFSDHELTGNVARWRAPSMAASSSHGPSWQDPNIGAANYQMPPANEHRWFPNDEMESTGSHSLPQGSGGGGDGGVLQEDDSELIPPDDRTIFLTFSRGYPISENDVREFFTRIYGEIFEGIYMQEVGEGEQALFARLVCRKASSIGVVLGGQRKARFNINGKHVWARKYIKKSPLGNTTTASSSTNY